MVLAKDIWFPTLAKALMVVLAKECLMASKIVQIMDLPVAQTMSQNLGVVTIYWLHAQDSEDISISFQP